MLKLDTAPQNQIKKDIIIINKDPPLFIFVDKSNNRYKVSKDTYSKLLNTKHHKIVRKI